MLEMKQMESGEQIRELVPGQFTLEIMGKREGSELTELTETPMLYGDPETARQVWHKQEHPVSCAVVCQEYIAEELLGKDFSEERMREYAEKREWFDALGTLNTDVGNLLEEMGLDVERTDEATIDDLKTILSSGGKAIVAVNNMTLHNRLYALLPSSVSNHAVEVIGIDERDPKHPKVILNDPGVSGGGGRVVPLSNFQTAWDKSVNYLVSVYRRKDGVSA